MANNTATIPRLPIGAALGEKNDKKKVASPPKNNSSRRAGPKNGELAVLPLEATGGSVGPLVPNPAALLSSSRTRYTLTPREGTTGGDVSPRRLTPRELRSIGTFIAANKSLNHTHRSGKLGNFIPPSAFTKLLDNRDAILGLSIASIHPKESALDVPLRLAAPEDPHYPGVSDPRSATTMTSRMMQLLKGVSQVPQHWSGEKEGTERDVNHNNVIRDYDMRVVTTRRSGNVKGEAHAHFALASLHYNAGAMERAIQEFTLADALFTQLGDARSVALCQNLLGVAYFHIQEFKMGIVHHRKQEILGGAYARCVAQINMGVCYGVLGELSYAEQAFMDAAMNAAEAKDTVLETIAIGNLGVCHLRMGDMKKAQDEIAQCLEQCSVGGDKVGAAVCLLLLGEIYSLICDFPHAQFYFEHAFRVGEEAGCRDLTEIARVSVGVARGSQTVKEAMLKTAQQMGHNFNVRDVMLCLPQGP